MQGIIVHGVLGGWEGERTEAALQASVRDTTVPRWCPVNRQAALRDSCRPTLSPLCMP